MQGCKISRSYVKYYMCQEVDVIKYHNLNPQILVATIH